MVREDYKKGEVVKTTKVGNNLPVAPPNIGPKTFPNYGNFVAAATRTLKDGTKLFVGTRDDPFFVDLGAAFDAINVRVLTGNQGSGRDDLSGYWTSSTIMQIPEALVTRDHKPVASADAANAVVGVWSTTERRKLEVTNANYGAGSSEQVNGKSNKWVQVSRLGNPLINEVVIPLGKKDKFNRTTPDRDAELYGQYVVNPELAAVLNALFDVNAPETDRTDIVQAVLQGIPGLNEHSGKFAGTPVDTLKLNLGVPPSAQPEPLRRHRRRPGRLPERASSDRRCRRHRPPGDRRVPGGQQGAARGRRRPDRRPVPGPVPVPGGPAVRVRLEPGPVHRAAPTRRSRQAAAEPRTARGERPPGRSPRRPRSQTRG